MKISTLLLGICPGRLVRILSLCWSIHFPVGPNLEHRVPFGVSVITHKIRHTVGLLWTSDQPDVETSTYSGQHNI
jgi:hypothetical protein